MFSESAAPPAALSEGAVRSQVRKPLWSLCASTVLLTPLTVRWGIWNLLVRALNSLHCRCRLCLMRHWVSSLCLTLPCSTGLRVTESWCHIGEGRWALPHEVSDPVTYRSQTLVAGRSWKVCRREGVGTSTESPKNRDCSGSP